jgi:multidrug resistance efflux pump
MRGKWILVAGSVILLGMAAGALSLLRRAPSERAGLKQGKTRSDASPASEIVLAGKIQAQHVVLVGVQVNGTVESFLVDVGQEVYQGQLLAHIRSEGLESARETAAAEVDRIQSRITNLEGSIVAARLEASRARNDAGRAKTEFDRAEKAYQRQQVLNREGATPRLTFEKSQKEYENAKADYEALDEVSRSAEDRVAAMTKNLDAARKLLQDKNQDLEAAKADLAAAEIHAPVDGIVIGRRGAEGDEVTQQTKDLFQIAVDLSQLEAVVEPSPAILDRIKPGLPALLQIAEIPGQGIEGKVLEVRGNEVVVEFLSPTPAIKPGLTAQVRIRLT